MINIKETIIFDIAPIIVGNAVNLSFTDIQCQIIGKSVFNFIQSQSHSSALTIIQDNHQIREKNNANKYHNIFLLINFWIKK